MRTCPLHGAEYLKPGTLTHPDGAKTDELVCIYLNCNRLAQEITMVPYEPESEPALLIFEPNRLPQDCSDEDCMEEALRYFTDWLNAHHRANEDKVRADGSDGTPGTGAYTEVPYVLTRAEYDEYSDPPRVIGAIRPLVARPGNRYQLQDLGQRTILIYASPYHDEGGPNYLTCFFELDSEWDPDANAFGPQAWVLNDMIQEFDTDKQFILKNRTPEGLPE